MSKLIYPTKSEAEDRYSELPRGGAQATRPLYCTWSLERVKMFTLTLRIEKARRHWPWLPTGATLRQSGSFSMVEQIP